MGPLWTSSQRTTATVQFTGAVPTGVLSEPVGAQANSHKLSSYTNLTSLGANAVAGLFDPSNHPSPVIRAWRVKRISLSLGGQSSWRFDIIDQASTVRLASAIVGTTETSYFTEWDDEIILVPGEKLALYTTGMTAAGLAVITFERA